MATIVQNRYAKVINSSAPTLAYLSDPTSGNLLLVANGFNSTTVTMTVPTDTLGHTYATASPLFRGTTNSIEAHQAPATAAGANTVTWHLSATSLNWLNILEISGHNTTTLVDGVTSTNGSATGTINAGSLNTNAAAALSLGYWRTATAANVWTSAADWNFVGTVTSGLAVVSRALTATAAYNPALVKGSLPRGWVAMHLVIADTSAGGGGTTNIDAALSGVGTLTASVVPHIPIAAALVGEG